MQVQRKKIPSLHAPKMGARATEKRVSETFVHLSKFLGHNIYNMCSSWDNQLQYYTCMYIMTII